MRQARGSGFVRIPFSFPVWLSLSPLSIFLFQSLILAGGLAVSSRFTDPGALKLPLMLAGLVGLVLIHLRRLRPPFYVLIPFLGYWMYRYLHMAPGASPHGTALALCAVMFAFLAGLSRVRLADGRVLAVAILLCVARGVLDLVTLSHLGGATGEVVAVADAVAHVDAVTSFFLDKHTYGILLVLAAFLHFHWMERRDPHKPVQVFLYTAAFLVLASILLVDSRTVQGVFFLCFLPLLFVSVRLDFAEPRPERLAWIAGITLCLGLAWTNLPERQLQKMAQVFSPSAGQMQWAWASAWDTFMAKPMFGHGTGSFRYAVVPHDQTGGPPVDGDELPGIENARNHFLQLMAEAGTVGLALELLLLGVACFGMVRIYLREARLEAKYAFFSLAALALQGLFSPVLERAPVLILYWALVGYGWSLAFEGVARPTSRLYPKALLAFACAALAALHVAGRAAELRSDAITVKARAKGETDPRAFTDLLAEALRIDPLNEEANFDYAIVLSGFRRGDEAIKRLEYVQGFAPNPIKRAHALAVIHFSLARYDSAALYSRQVLRKHPYHLPSLEILMESLIRAGHCRSADSLAGVAGAMLAKYPTPRSQDYTMGSLDSLFRRNQEVNFLQRWFGGKTLREKFVENRTLTYNQRYQSRGRIGFLMENGCGRTPDPDSLSPAEGPLKIPSHKPAAPSRRRWWKTRGLGLLTPGLRPARDEAPVDTGFPPLPLGLPEDAMG